MIETWLLLVKSLFDFGLIIPLKVFDFCISGCEFLGNNLVHLSLLFSLKFIHAFFCLMYSLVKSLRVIRFHFSKCSLFDADLLLELLTSGSNEFIKCLALILNCFLKLSNKFLDFCMMPVIVMAMTLSVANMLFFFLLGVVENLEFTTFLVLLDLPFNVLSESLDPCNSGCLLLINSVDDSFKHDEGL